MNPQKVFRLGLMRFGLLFAISLLAVGVISEVTFRMQKDENDRPPQLVQLIIPEGTGEELAAGEPSVTFPEEMVFVVGDTLVVKNEDISTHRFGPLLVPAKTSATLKLDKPDRSSYSCTFVPSQYIGLDVRPQTGWMARFQALWLAAPATAAFLFAYSLVLVPLQPRNKPIEAYKIH